jgi:hypothetical protein
MSKKKNTLKDLDEFLKQQAATLVTPSRLSEKSEPADVKETAAPVQETIVKITEKATVSATSIINDLRELSLSKGDSFTQELSDIILAVMERQKNYSPEEKMLINTALYLKYGTDWKENIRRFWKDKNS